MIPVFSEDLHRSINEEREALKNAIAEGTLSHDKYLHMTGILRGLLVAERFIDAAAQKYLED